MVVPWAGASPAETHQSFQPPPTSGDLEEGREGRREGGREREKDRDREGGMEVGGSEVGR